MSFLRQIGAASALNVRALPTRWGASLVVIAGVAAVVGVLISILAIASALERTAHATGSVDGAIVLRGGSTAELNSSLSRDQATTISDAAGVKRTADGAAEASAEVVMSVALQKRGGGEGDVTIRGVGDRLFDVRPNVRIVEGRMFRATSRELIVGRALRRAFGALQVGTRIDILGTPWTVAGIFESGGDWHESELMAPRETLMSMYRRTEFQSVTVLLRSPEAFAAFKEALTDNPTLSVSVERERDYYADVSRELTSTITLVAYLVGGIMALGALVSAANCMYAAVSARLREIGTLRAIGFGGAAVVVSVFAEAFTLALGGGLLGSALAWAVFHGSSVSVLGSLSSLAEVVFRVSVTLPMAVMGITWACAIGALGALFPAIRSARVPVAVALQQF